VLAALLLEPAQLELAYSVGQVRLSLVLYAAIFLVTLLPLPRGIVPPISGRLEGWRATRRSDAPPAVVGQEEHAASR